MEVSDFLFYSVFIAKSRQTLCGPTDCSPPGSSVHGISQARILEWVATCWWDFKEISYIYKYLYLCLYVQLVVKETHVPVQVAMDQM